MNGTGVPRERQREIECDHEKNIERSRIRMIKWASKFVKIQEAKLALN